jgi:hypothetical protein
MADRIQTDEFKNSFNENVIFWNRFSQHIIWTVICLTSSLAACAYFIHIRDLPHNAGWWGHTSNGIAGVVLSLTVTVMVFFGLKFLGTLFCAMSLTTNYFKGPVNIDLFHKDEANGILMVGKTILLFWLCATILGLAISLVMYTGYLDLYKSALGWWLSLLCIIVVPLVSARPLLGAIQAIEVERRAQLDFLGQQAGEARNAIAGLPLNSTLIDKRSSLEALANSLSAINFIRGSNRFPFDPRASLILVAVYFAQIALFVYKLIR